MDSNLLVEKLPDPLKKEVEDFVDFLIFKNETHSVLLTRETAPTYGNSLSSQKKIKNSNLSSKPAFGSGKGIFGKIADDFDEPLDEMKGYM